jgi:hypothetical protein
MVGHTFPDLLACTSQIMPQTLMYWLTFNICESHSMASFIFAFLLYNWHWCRKVYFMHMIWQFLYARSLIYHPQLSNIHAHLGVPVPFHTLEFTFTTISVYISSLLLLTCKCIPPFNILCDLLEGTVVGHNVLKDKI